LHLVGILSSRFAHDARWQEHKVFEQFANSRAFTMLRYTRCNVVILMAATAWLMSFSSCIMCGFDSYTLLFKCPQRTLWGHLRSTFKGPQSNFLWGNLKSISSVLREIFSGDTWKVRYKNQIRTRYRNWRTSATQLQPSKSLCYIGYTSTWSDVRSCVLMQEATTCSIFYDGISFQHLATVLISVFPLCYGPGLLFRGPFCRIKGVILRLGQCYQLSSAVF